MITPDGVTDSNPDVISGAGAGRNSVNGPTTLSLQMLNRQTENDSGSRFNILPNSFLNTYINSLCQCHVTMNFSLALFSSSIDVYMIRHAYYIHFLSISVRLSQ